MKKLITITFLLVCSIAYGQHVQLKETGFVGIADSTKNYAVIEVPKLKQAELYKKVLTYLNSIYKNPSAVLSTVDGESITVNGFNSSISTSKGLYKYPFNYNIVLQFKDGKIKYQPRLTEIHELFEYSNRRTPFYISNTESPNKVEINSVYIFSEKTGKHFLFKKDVKDEFDKWANGYLNDIAKNINDNW